ncbi:60S ribosomal protein L7 [Conglomerata obtusa]
MHKTVPQSYSQQQEFLKTQAQNLALQKAKHETRKQENISKAHAKVIKHINTYKTLKLETEMKQQDAQKNNAFYVPAEPHFFLVVRIRGMNRVPPKERKTLDILRLRAPNTCILLKNNLSTRNMLQLVRNYVGYGTIDISLLRELIYKRGMAKVDGEVVNITNENVEDFFGDLMCVEDVVESLWSDRNFSKVNRFLMPFKLNCPRGGFKGKKSKDVLEGGSCGNHYDNIGDLIKRMID